MCWNKGRLYWKIAKLFYLCHLKISWSGRKLSGPPSYWIRGWVPPPRYRCGRFGKKENSLAPTRNPANPSSSHHTNCGVYRDFVQSFPSRCSVNPIHSYSTVPYNLSNEKSVLWLINHRARNDTQEKEDNVSAFPNLPK